MSSTTDKQDPIYSRLASDADLGEIITMFVEEMPSRVSSLLSQLETMDWPSLRRTAHQLKGAAGSYGFDIISPCAGKVEAAIRDGDTEEHIRQMVDELVDLCNRAKSGTPV